MASDLFTDGIEPNSNDVVIAVMGMTGAGKSSFIALCSDKKPAIGHDLSSCTRCIDTYPFVYAGPPRKRVFLVDTPGFDDSTRTDSELLRELAAWLSATYTRDIRLSGIIYLHCINQPRMQGSAKRNITLFKKLCGDDALRNVILATTMWDLVGEDVGAMREQELISTPAFWGYMHSKGSNTYRHHNTHASAMNLIGHFIKTERKLTLDIQAEMVHQRKDLDGTAAAATVGAQLELERARFTAELHNLKTELKDAVRKKDHDTIDMLQEARDKYESDLAQIKLAHENLRASMQTLHAERYANLERAMKEQQETYTAELSAADQRLARAQTSTNAAPLAADGVAETPQAYGAQGADASTAETFGGREEHPIIIWDNMTGRHVSSLYSHTDEVRLITLSSDGKRLISESLYITDLGSEKKVWDVTTGTCLLTTSDYITVSSDCTRFLKTAGNSIQIFDLATGRCKVTIELPPPYTIEQGVYFSADGTRAMCQSKEYIWTWDTETGQLVSKVYEYYSSYSYYEWSECRTWYLKRQGGTDYIRNSITGASNYAPYPFKSVNGAVWSTRGTMIAVNVCSIDFNVQPWTYELDQAANHQVLIYDTERVELKCTIDGAKAYDSSIVWSHDESMVAVKKYPAATQSVMIYNTVTGRRVSTLIGHNGDVLSMAWSRDGKRLASVSRDKTARIWKVATGRCLLTLSNPADPGTRGSVARFLDDGRLIATIGLSLVIWDTNSGRCVGMITGHLYYRGRR